VKFWRIRRCISTMTRRRCVETDLDRLFEDPTIVPVMVPAPLGSRRRSTDKSKARRNGLCARTLQERHHQVVIVDSVEAGGFRIPPNADIYDPVAYEGRALRRSV
jgi:hypothetical protein